MTTSHWRLCGHTSPDLAPGRAPISDPGASGAIPGSSLRVRGRSVARPCTSGAIRGDPGSTPEVLKCLKHPGRSGEDVNPWLIRGSSGGRWGSSVASTWLVRGRPGVVGSSPGVIRRWEAKDQPRCSHGRPTDDPRMSRMSPVQPPYEVGTS